MADHQGLVAARQPPMPINLSLPDALWEDLPRRDQMKEAQQLIAGWPSNLLLGIDA